MGTLMLMGVGSPIPEFPPSLLDGFISVLGTTLTLDFQEPVFAGVGSPTLLVDGVSYTITYVSGSGTPTWTYTVSPTVLYGQVVTLSAAAGVWVSPLVGDTAFTNYPITNLSQVQALPMLGMLGVRLFDTLYSVIYEDVGSAQAYRSAMASLLFKN